MAMGTKRAGQKQEELFYASERAEAPGHPFYEQLNRVLNEARFDEMCERRCRGFYHNKLGGHRLAPGVYFRLLLIGFFEGIASERGIAWRVADSLRPASFSELWTGRNDAGSHVTIARTRRLLNEATHQAVFTFVLTQVAKRGLLRAKPLDRRDDAGSQCGDEEFAAARQRRDYMEYLPNWPPKPASIQQ